MRRQIQLWGTRFLSLGVIVFAVQHWGAPMYKDYLTPKTKTPFVPTAIVKQGRFVVSFHQIGAIEAERSVNASTEIEGKVIKLIEDGKMVQSGDTIAVLDTTLAQNEILARQLKLNQATAAVATEKAKLEILKEQNKTAVAEAQAELDFNKSELEHAQKDLDKKTALAAQKLIPKDEVDKAAILVRTKDLAVRKGEMQLDLKQKEIASNEEQKKADVVTAESAANLAKVDLNRWKEQLNKAIIKAPSAGMVVLTVSWMGGERRKLKEGDVLWRSFCICSIPDLTSMQVKAQVGEADAHKVKVGMSAVVRLEAVPNRIFHGTVKEISNLASEKMFWEGGEAGKKNFEVRIDLKEIDPKALKPGITADVEFVEKTIDKVIYVPVEAVMEESGKTFVFLKKGNRYLRHIVKTGAQNDSFIVITKGLAKDQKVALQDPTRPPDEQPDRSEAASKEDQVKKQPPPIPTTSKAKS